MLILKYIGIFFLVSMLVYIIIVIIFARVMQVSGTTKNKKEILDKIPNRDEEIDGGCYGYWEMIHPSLKKDKEFMKELIIKNPMLAPYILFEYKGDKELNKVLLDNYMEKSHFAMNEEFINEKENFEKIYSLDKSIMTNKLLDDYYRKNKDIFEELYREKSVYILGMDSIYSEDDEVVASILTAKPHGFNESFLSEKYKDNIDLAIKLVEIDKSILEDMNPLIRHNDEFLKGLGEKEIKL